MLVNTMLVRWYGGWAEVTDGVSVGIFGQMEATLGLGAVQTIDTVAEIAQSQLAIYGNQREEYTLGIEPIAAGDTPYVSYLVGDTVTIDEPNAFPTDERVISMTVTSDPNSGRALFSPTVKDVLLSEQERMSQGFKKMSNGTLRGDSKVATPVDNVPPPQSGSITRARRLPFLVVAKNGSGDFTSVKDAIDSLPTATFTVIFVVDGNYTDGSSVIDVSGKEFLVTGKLAPTSNGLFSGNWAGPQWTFGGFTATSSTEIELAGLDIRQSGSAVLTAGAGVVTLTISDCDVTWNGILSPSSGGRAIHCRRCSLVGRLVNGDGTVASINADISIKDCYTQEFLDGTVTWPSGIDFYYHDNIIGPDAGGSGDIHTFTGNVSIVGNQWIGSSGNRIGITWTPTTTEKAFRLVGNVSGAGGSSIESDIIVDYSNAFQAATVIIAGNTMREVNLTVDGPAVSSRQDTYIAGAYHTLTVNASNVRADVALNLATDTGLTALTVAGDQNLIVAALNGGTGAVSTPYAVAATADRNVFVLSGETSFTAAGTDVGTNNQRASLVAL